MGDDKTKVGQQDRTRINSSEDYEMTYWAEKFGVSKEVLLEAIQKSGSNSVVTIEEYLTNR